MLKWICAAALVLVVAEPALAQKPKESRPLKMTKTFDTEPIKEGIRAVKQSGECIVTFVVSTEGKPKNAKADCTVPELAPFAIRSVESSEWQAEIFQGEVFESDPIKQTFKFGAVAPPAADPRGEKAPVQVKGLDTKEIERAIAKVGEKVERCDPTFTVGADGKTKDIVPNCTPQALNPAITDAIKKMEYTPGQKGGQPTDWPNMQMPMNLGMNVKQN